MTTYVDANTTTRPARDGTIKLHGLDGCEGMRKAGRLSAEILDALADFIVPGVTTEAIDDFVRNMTLAAGAIPATLGYRGYTHSCCTSINHVVCHGIPSDKRLQNGDIINIDVTVILDGWYGDTSRMFFAGDVSVKAKRLCDVTYESMMRGIAAVKPGAHVGDIGHAIQSYVEAQRFSVVRDFSGHGLGRIFHDAPNILHYGKKGSGPVLKPGMFFTVEPMVNAGTWQVKILSDGWTAVTRDKQLSAQYEHSVGVTETGVEFFTLSPMGLAKPPYDLAGAKPAEERNTATA